MGLFNRNGGNKPGTDWAAKHESAGSDAKPYQDRPHAIDASANGDLGDGGICRDPSNKYDDE